MKNYELIIEACHTNDEFIYRSKGHHDFDDFKNAMIEYGLKGKWGIPIHVYVKTIPAPKDSGYRCLYTIVEQGTRGSYPATYVYEYGKEYMQL